MFIPSFVSKNMDNVKFQVAPTGKLVQGTVFDGPVAPLKRALADHDSQLYLKWNTKKLGGMGVWELRRRPDSKQVVESVSFQGNTISVVDYKELPIVAHVKDFPCITERIYEWVKANDVYQDKFGIKGNRWAAELEYQSGQRLNREAEHAEKERDYAIRQHKSLIREYKEYVLSGHNPYRILDHMGNKKGS